MARGYIKEYLLSMSDNEVHMQDGSVGDIEKAELDNVKQYLEFNFHFSRLFQERHERWNDKIVQFLNTTAQVLGITAGLGFTGITKVASLERFVFGEVVLLCAMVLAIHYSKFVAVDPLTDIENTLVELYKKNSEISKALAQNDKTKLSELSKEFNEDIKGQKEADMKLVWGSEINIRIRVLMSMILVGGIVVFTSFLKFSFLW